MDHLSQALADMHLRGSLIATLDLGAPWRIDFQASVGVPVHYVIEGEIWLSAFGEAPLRLSAGDLVMFSRWDRHVMASSLEPAASLTISDLVRLNGRKLWAHGEWSDQPLPLVLPGPGARSRLLSMVVEIERSVADVLLLTLPRLVRIAGDDALMAPWLTPILQFLAREEADRRAGYGVVQSRLAELLFMQIVRSQLLLRTGGASPALGVLADPAVRQAIVALHERPDLPWTLAGMAKVAGLSRSLFAVRFAQATQTTPFAFLRGLRLDAAAERLKQGEPVKALIEASGYHTAYAFTKAFRARFAVGPGAYRGLFSATPRTDRAPPGL